MGGRTRRVVFCSCRIVYCVLYVVCCMVCVLCVVCCVCRLSDWQRGAAQNRNSSRENANWPNAQAAWGAVSRGRRTRVAATALHTDRRIRVHKQRRLKTATTIMKLNCCLMWTESQMESKSPSQSKLQTGAAIVFQIYQTPPRTVCVWQWLPQHIAHSHSSSTAS